MRPYSRLVSSENITRVIDINYLPEEYVNCPVDKIYLRKETIDHEKLKLFKDQSKTIKLVKSLETIKSCRKIFFLKNCYVCEFDKLDVYILDLMFSKCNQVQMNPSKSSNLFFKTIQNFVCDGEDSKVMKLHVNNNFLYNNNPRTAINLIEIPRRHSFKRGFKGEGSLYAGSKQSVIVYDNFAKDSSRCKGSTRVEFKYNSSKTSPIANFSQFDSLSINKKLFTNVKLPKVLVHRETSDKEYEALKLYMEHFFKNKRCHTMTAQKAFKGKSREFRDAFRRCRQSKIAEYVDLNEIYRRDFQIYLSKPMTSSEKEFCKTYAESLRREV